MTIKTQSIAGATGYRDQLSRARRFLQRIETAVPEDMEWPDDVGFQDDVWAFFQNCWHVRDWVKNDPIIQQATKDAVLAEAHKSDCLTICQQMANGTKHLGKREGASHGYVEITGIRGGPTFAMDCFLENGAGELLSAKSVARKCVAEWERILSAHGLPIPRG